MTFPGSHGARMLRRGAKHSPDRHERQARDAGLRFRRGENGLGTGLTPVAPAGYVLPSSRGEALPGILRTELSRAFDADLTAIRVHRDASAESAVRATGAMAFASGADIYFGSGRYNPETQSGRELIAHEVAHVLQQTGRRSYGERLMATQVHSASGLIQCNDEPATDLPGSEALFQELVDLYARLEPASDFQQTVTEVRTLLNN